MIRHILMVQFNPTATQEALLQVQRLFKEIPANIAGVTDIEWGENNSPESLAKGFTHCIQMTFKDESIRQSYLPHPAHDALKSVFVPLIEDIIVFDYELTGS